MCPGPIISGNDRPSPNCDWLQSRAVGVALRTPELPPSVFLVILAIPALSKIHTRCASNFLSLAWIDSSATRKYFFYMFSISFLTFLFFCFSVQPGQFSLQFSDFSVQFPGQFIGCVPQSGEYQKISDHLTSGGKIHHQPQPSKPQTLSTSGIVQIREDADKIARVS